VIGYALFLRIGESFSYAGILLPTMLLIGAGFALCFPSLNMQATAGVPDHEQGLASGLVNTSFQVGGAVVLAVVTAVVSANSGSGGEAAALLDGFRPAIGVVTGVAVAGLVVAVVDARIAAARTGEAAAAPVEPLREPVPEREAA
jgi:hypothetical protein